MDFTGDSQGWNGLYRRFTGLEWIFMKMHWAGMTLTFLRVAAGSKAKAWNAY
jgi:hypothetical protein